MRATDYIIKLLNSLGIRHVFGVGGANIEDIYDAAFHANSNLKTIVAKHEFSAAAMACGYSRISHSLGVVIATSGGGCLNTISALGEAYCFDDPILAILGQPLSQGEGRGVFQDTSGYHQSINGLKLFSCVASKYIKKTSNVTDLPKQIHAAITAALSEPTGTSILLLNKDLQQQNLPDDTTILPVKPKKMHFSKKYKQLLEETVLAWNVAPKALRFTLILGPNTIKSQSKELCLKLAKVLDANLMVTPDAVSVIDHRNPRFLGAVGVTGHQSISQCIDNTDVIIIIGSRFSTTTYADIKSNLRNKIILYLETKEPFDYSVLENNSNKVIMVKTNINKSLKYLLTQLKKVAFKNTMPQINYPLRYKPPFSLTHLNPFNFASILNVFNQHMESDAHVFADAGNTGAAVLHYLIPPAQGYFGIALGMGGMGFAIGAGIGAAFASDKKVYIFMGDGAFLMHGMELHTAIEHNLPVVFVIFNNNAHAMCYTREVIFYKGEYTYNLFKPAYYGEGLKAMFPSLKLCEDINDLTHLEKYLLESQKIFTPAVLSLNVDPMEFPPFYPLFEAYKKLQKK